MPLLAKAVRNYYKRSSGDEKYERIKTAAIQNNHYPGTTNRQTPRMNT